MFLSDLNIKKHRSFGIFLSTRTLSYLNFFAVSFLLSCRKPTKIIITIGYNYN